VHVRAIVFVSVTGILGVETIVEGVNVTVGVTVETSDTVSVTVIPWEPTPASIPTPITSKISANNA